MLFYVLIACALVAIADATCQFHVTVFRQLRKEGFHLGLLSSVEIVVGSEQCPIWDTCTLALAEPITSSFFIKSDELSRSSVVGCSSKQFNIEEPQNKSSPGVVYLYSPLQVSLNLVHAKLILPLHVRYHSPHVGGGYTLTTLYRPRLLLQCEQAVEALETAFVRAACPVCSKKDCNWVELPYKTNAENFTVPVPVGDLEHYPLVAFTTFLLAFGGCLYLSLTVINVVNVH